MPLVNTKKMFEMAYKNGYAVGAFNVNNMEITQGIADAVAQEKAPLILQVSRGARAYAKNSYLKAIIDVVVRENPGIPIAINLDHGPCVYITTRLRGSFIYNVQEGWAGGG